MTTLNINGFNKYSDQFTGYISEHDIHLICIQETHTIQLSHFFHPHKFLAYPNTNQSLFPHITYHQEDLILIDTQLIELTSQMIKTYTILPNYIQSLSFPLSNTNYTLINCYLPSGKTSPQTLQRIIFVKLN